MSVLERAAAAQVAVARRVDDVRTIHEHQPGGHETHRRIGRGGDERRQPTRCNPRVVVQEGEVRRIGTAGARFVAGCEPGIRLEREHAALGKPFAHEIDRAVGRAVVDDDDFKGLKVLLSERSQARTEPRSAVPVQDDHANERRLFRSQV